MTKAERAHSEIGAIEKLAGESSPVHCMSALSKLFVTILYIAIVVSFNKYNFTGLVVMVIFPVIGYFTAGVPVSLCFRKLRIVMPIVCLLGIINPFLDRDIVMHIGTLAVSGGVISMLTLIMKGIFSLMMSFLLIATTRIDELCAGLRKIHIPKLLVTLFLLTYRYITVLLSEVAVMTEAYHLRSPGQRGINVKAWGSFLGQLILRSSDRAGELYSSMILRGFSGEFYIAADKKYHSLSWPAALITAALIVLARVFNITGAIGSLIV